MGSGKGNTKRVRATSSSPAKKKSIVNYLTLPKEFHDLGDVYAGDLIYHDSIKNVNDEYKEISFAEYYLGKTKKSYTTKEKEFIYLEVLKDLIDKKAFVNRFVDTRVADQDAWLTEKNKKALADLDYNDFDIRIEEGVLDPGIQEFGIRKFNKIELFYEDKKITECLSEWPLHVDCAIVLEDFPEIYQVTSPVNFVGNLLEEGFKGETLFFMR